MTWLWTANVVHPGGTIASPAPWWPGRKYVTWVGLDGYYYEPSWKFAPLFGPTIAAVRELTRDPILIWGAAVSPTVNQPAKIADLFAGIRLYELLGLVSDSVHNLDWRLTNSAAIAAFRRGAKSYHALRARSPPATQVCCLSWTCRTPRRDPNALISCNARKTCPRRTKRRTRSALLLKTGLLWARNVIELILFLGDHHQLAHVSLYTVNIVS